MVNTNEPDWNTVLMSQIASRGISDESGTRREGGQRVMKDGRCSGGDQSVSRHPEGLNL